MTDSLTVLHNKQNISVVSQEILDQLKVMAHKAPLKRARLCLHLDPVDPVQEMVIVLHRESYIRPHRHQGKSESFHMIEGSVLVVFFDDDGKILHKVHLTAGPEFPFLYRLSVSMWHLVVPMSEFAVFHEVSTGPFSPSEFPSWEPKNHPDAINAFKNFILSSL